LIYSSDRIALDHGGGAGTPPFSHKCSWSAMAKRSWRPKMMPNSRKCYLDLQPPIRDDRRALLDEINQPAVASGGSSDYPKISRDRLMIA